MKQMKTVDLIYLSFFIALEVILTRFLSIQTPIVRIGFTFLPIAISAILYGPVTSGICAVLADLIGMMLFPSGAYFPGFTLTAFLTGASYGLFLYQKPMNLFRITAAAVTVSVLINLGLDTVWIWMITGKGFLAILPARLLKTFIMIPIQIITIEMLGNRLRFLWRGAEWSKS